MRPEANDKSSQATRSSARAEEPVRSTRAPRKNTFPGSAEARLQLGLSDRRDGPRPVGLDGVPRVSPNGRFRLPVAIEGGWESDSIFSFDYNEVAHINTYHCRLTFAGNGVTVELSERSRAQAAARFHGRSK